MAELEDRHDGEDVIRATIANFLFWLSRRIAPTKRLASWVYPDGIATVPLRIVKQMGLENGGGVCFVARKDGIVEMLTGEQFDRIFGGEE